MKTMNLVLIIVLGGLSACSFKEDVPPKVVEVPEKKTELEITNELFDAVLKKDYKTVESLIKAGANLEEYDSQGSTVLIRAVQMRDPILVEILLGGAAKPFNFQKDKSKETAFSKISADDTEIKKLFDQKIADLVESIKNRISQKNYSGAKEIVDENMVPFDFLVEGEKSLVSFIFDSIDQTNPRPVVLLKYMIEGRSYESINILAEKEHLIRASNKMEDREFYSYTLDLLFKGGVSAESILLEESLTQSAWFAVQLDVLSSKNMNLEPNYFYGMVLDKVKSAVDVDYQSAKDIFSSFLKFKVPDNFKNSSAEGILGAIYSSNNLQNKIEKIKEILTIREKFNLQKSGFSLDVHGARLLPIIFTEHKDDGAYIETIKMLMNYTTNRESEETLSAVMLSNFPMGAKSQILEFVLSYTEKIPKGAFAAAVQNNDIGILSLLIDSKIPFDAHEQSDAILMAVEKSKTGPVAQSYLIALKQSNIGFANSNGASALVLALERVIMDGDSSYIEVIDFLIALSDHPVNQIDGKTRTKIIFDLISASGKNSSLLNIANKFLIKSSVVSDNIVFKSKIEIEGNKFFNILTTVTWAVILKMHKAKQESSDDYGNLKNVLKSMLRVFAQDQSAMTADQKGAIFNSDLLITQQMLPLSLLLWIGKNKIQEINEISFATEQSLPVALAPISMNHLINGDIFSYLSQDKDFWKEIINLFVNHGNVSISSLNSQSVYDFNKIVLGADALESFPAFAKSLLIFASPITTADAVCKTEKMTESEKNLWTTLGSFVALESLFQKSCSGENLSEKEAGYFNEFSRSQIEVGVSILSTESMVEDCKPYEAISTINGWNKSDFSLTAFSDLGTRLLKEFDSDSMLSNPSAIASDLSIIMYYGKKCRTSNFDSEVHKQAKLQFLKEWQTCVVKNQDEKMINFMQGIDSKYNFSSVTSSVMVCR